MGLLAVIAAQAYLLKSGDVTEAPGADEVTIPYATTLAGLWESRHTTVDDVFDMIYLTVGDEEDGLVPVATYGSTSPGGSHLLPQRSSPVPRALRSSST